MAIVQNFQRGLTTRNIVIGGVALAVGGFALKLLYDRYFSGRDQPRPQQPAARTENPPVQQEQISEEASLLSKPAAVSSVYLEGEEETKRKQIKLIRKEKINHDTFFLYFSFDSSKTLGVPTGHHFRVFTKTVDGKPKHHSYTPLLPPQTKGELKLLVKVYYSSKEFPEGGIVTQQLEKLKEGETITIGGPRGKQEYLGNGKFALQNSEGVIEERVFTQVTYLLGGSGITPALAVLYRALADPTDTTQFTVVNSNKTKEDMLLDDQFVEWASHGKLKYFRTLTREEFVTEGWNKGRITEDYIKASIPEPSESHGVFYCGPSGFNDTSKKILASLSHVNSICL